MRSAHKLIDMDDDLEFIEAVVMLAEMPTAVETPGVPLDEALDALIYAARKIKDREGFLVITRKL